MVTLEQKLDLFRKMVGEKVKKEADEQLAQKEEEIAAYLQEQKASLQRQTERSEKAASEKIRRQKSETISSLMQSQKRELLHLEEELLDDLMKKVEIKGRAFVESEAYPLFIEKALKSVLASFREGERLTIRMAPSSFARAKATADQVMEAAGCGSYALQEGEDAFIGGFVAENEDRTLRINKTVAEGIRRKREEIGHLLYEQISREG